MTGIFYKITSKMSFKTRPKVYRFGLRDKQKETKKKKRLIPIDPIPDKWRINLEYFFITVIEYNRHFSV